MTRPATALTLAVTFAAALFAGCKYSPGTPAVDRMPGTLYPQIVTLYGLDRGNLIADAPRVTPESDRPMSVTVPLRTKRREIPVQYRILFLDARGVPIDDDPHWQYAFLQPRARTFLTANAPDIGAVDWICEVRPDRVERAR